MSILYIVATPIGNLNDITHRAIETLRKVSLIAAEDTRHSRRLLDHYQIATKLISLHEHNEQQRSTYLLEQLQQGQTIALISDAGTPLISDPGYRLVQTVRAANIRVVPMPGPCALIAALSAAGLPSDRFIFEGFLSSKTTARKQQLQTIQYETRTSIFYESPHRILDLIDDMLAILGPERYVVLARELTKTFETIYGANLAELKEWLINDSNQQKGEFVVLVAGITPTTDNSTDLETTRVLTILLNALPTSQAIQLATQITGEKKNKLYDMALKHKQLP